MLASTPTGNSTLVKDGKYIRLDVHEATISAAVLDSTGKLVMESILETKAATILQFFQRFAEARTSKSRVESPNVRSSSFPNCKNVRSVLKPSLKLGDSCGEEVANSFIPCSERSERNDQTVVHQVQRAYRGADHVLQVVGGNWFWKGLVAPVCLAGGSTSTDLVFAFSFLSFELGVRAGSRQTHPSKLCGHES